MTYTDYQLRTITAHLLELLEFDEKAFTETIDRIEVLPDGSLQLTDKNGRNKVWQRM